ncbi:MAG: sugar ABC transporter ATP-binding protein, partial [Actinobacteria bacterium]|nr:sugar ABC transporter ATP-binding protein [Actinomycetota bacterium]
LAAGGEPQHEAQPGVAAPAADRAAGGPVLRVEALRIDPDASPIELELGRGEILGLAGLEGHGQTRFLETLAGRAKAAEGSVEVAVEGSWMPPGDPRTAADRGIAYVPRERKREGILPTRSVTENMTVSALPGLTTAGIVRPGPVKRLVAEMIERLRIKTQSPSSLITSLSGGNQQKVVLGRALSLRPHVLLLNDPLRGVDHGAKLEIHAVFRRLSAQGTTLVILSTEIEELLLLCGRIAVFREGSVEAILEARQTDQGAVVAAMFGSRAAEGDRG